MAEIEILSRGEQGRAVRPVVRVRGVALDCSLSISHTDRLVIAALAWGALSVGIDLVSMSGVNPAALRLWFTAREVELLRPDDPFEAARAWAVKEATYKALNNGEPFAPRRIEVVATRPDEFAIRYRGADLHAHCTVETWEIHNHVVALVTSDLARRSAAWNRAADQSLPLLFPA